MHLCDLLECFFYACCYAGAALSFSAGEDLWLWVVSSDWCTQRLLQGKSWRKMASQMVRLKSPLFDEVLGLFRSLMTDSFRLLL